MTTLEMVDFLNSLRVGLEPIRHDNLMRKVKSYFSNTDALVVEGLYQGGNGEMRPCLVLQKREAVFLAGTYSYKVAAAVYDRMTALEVSLSEADRVIATLRSENLRLLKAFHTLKSWGLHVATLLKFNEAEKQTDDYIKTHKRANWGTLMNWTLQHKKTFELPYSTDMTFAQIKLLESGLELKTPTELIALGQY